MEFVTLLRELTQPQAFSSGLAQPVVVLQTHASAVLLTENRAYKLKKPKNYGFFDYSTPARRRYYCGEEVRLNRRLAPQVYLGVAPVLSYADGTLGFGPTLSPDDVPEPEMMLGGGQVVDYAVVMVRLPEEETLEALVRAGTATAALLEEIACFVANFHASSQTNEHIASFGALEVIRTNWEENFAQMQPYIGRTLDANTYDLIAGYIRRFLDKRAALFANRVQDDHIRDCHGDLRLQHVYSLGVPDHTTHQLAILDCIEFNERFRYGDVASEVAFLTMELDAAGRTDLSRAFVKSYVAQTGDRALQELLPFYICYRACVRGKVLSFQLDELEVPEVQRELARGEAAALFSLAASYASGPTQPVLVILGGLMGTGKSSLAYELHGESGWALFSSDVMRKRLAQIHPILPRTDVFGEGLYSPEWSARTYASLYREAGALLANGRSVLLDASFLRREDRLAAAHEAIASGADVLFVECVCPPEIALQRLTQRWQVRMEKEQTMFTEKEAYLASDGRPDLYESQRTVWQAFDAKEEQHMRHILVNTTHPLHVCVEQVLSVLGMPRLACWL